MSDVASLSGDSDSRVRHACGASLVTSLSLVGEPGEYGIDRHDQPSECDVMVQGGSLPGASLATPAATRVRFAGAFSMPRRGSSDNVVRLADHDGMTTMGVDDGMTTMGLA